MARVVFSARWRSGVRPSTRRSDRTRVGNNGRSTRYRAIGRPTRAANPSDSAAVTESGREASRPSREVVGAVPGAVPVEAAQSLERHGQRDTGGKEAAHDEQDPEADTTPADQRDRHELHPTFDNVPPLSKP